MRGFAITIAVLGFFAMSAVGLECGVPVFPCAMRALAGAAGLYILAKLAGKVVLNIVVDAVVRDQSKRTMQDPRDR